MMQGLSPPHPQPLSRARERGAAPGRGRGEPPRLDARHMHADRIRHRGKHVQHVRTLPLSRARERGVGGEGRVRHDKTQYAQ